MVDLPQREERNKLRQVVLKAQKDMVMTQEEAGFVITLIERFRKDTEKKEKQLLTIQGELNQLRVNEQIIIQLIESMVSAAERDIARQETMARLKEARGVEDARHAERAERNKEPEIKEPEVREPEVREPEVREQGDLPQVPPALTR